MKKPENRRQALKTDDGQPRAKRGSRPITDKEANDVEEMSSPRTPVIYEVVRRLGDEEMDRPITSLWWSGVAAGLSISFSLKPSCSRTSRNHGGGFSLRAWAIAWGS